MINAPRFASHVISASNWSWTHRDFAGAHAIAVSALLLGVALGLGVCSNVVMHVIIRRRHDSWLARNDQQTGLPNRLMLTEVMSEALRRSGKARAGCAFLMIDLDRFKTINDTLGHPIGDRLLKMVADRLKSLTGETAVCGRLGGDEFGMMIRNVADPARIDRMAQVVVDRLSQPYAVDDQVLHIGASIGAVVRPQPADTVASLLRNADLALYRAKHAGGGQVCRYEPALLAEVEERSRLELALRHALHRDELRLEFQPVVDTLDESIVSFEALLRWQSPDLGVVAPSRFLPLAEETRLIVPIGN